MKIIQAKFIYINGEYKQNLAVAFDKTIKDIDSFENLQKRYDEYELLDYSGNYVLYPGFINMHTHLEFSANRATLEFGDFIKWLYSVIENRDMLVSKLDSKTLKDATKEMLKSGITTFGAISSFGADLQVCAKTPQRVIYFNEVIGSNPAMVDALFSDFKQRLEASKEYASSTFYPAIAIHSPYSVHPILLREVLKIAKEQNMLTTAHFLESPAEREWLESSSGDFLQFFSDFFGTKSAVTTINEFLDSFKEPTLFTHATQATSPELSKINQNNHSIIHCPRSNRVLNCGKLDIKEVKNLLIGTDGLSSNYSLNILDELRSALFMHTDIEPKKLAYNLIEAITTNASNATNLKIGKIQKDYFADFALYKLPDDLKHTDKGSLALHTILNCKYASKVFIGGEIY
jgi:cytosine/adenosine deaminase-related metal-dependent hydrolase